MLHLLLLLVSFPQKVFPMNLKIKKCSLKRRPKYDFTFAKDQVVRMMIFTLAKIMILYLSEFAIKAILTRLQGEEGISRGGEIHSKAREI